LADGNRIVQRNGSRVYRDSQGRTRLEQTIGGIGAGAAANAAATLISINDPVAETAYTLDPQRQIARQFRPLKLALGNGAAFEAAAPVPAPPIDVAGGVGLRTTLRAETVELPEPSPRPGLVMNRLVTSRSFSAAGSFGMGEPRTEDLGDQVIEGVLAHGTRHVQTIEAGAIGNERPIEIVSEQWYSEEIEAVVLRRNVDPRFGETTYRLVNVNR